MIRWLLGILLTGVLLVGGAAAWAFHNLERLVNDFRDEASVEVSRHLGRQVQFGPVKLTTRNDELGALFTDVFLAGPARSPVPQARVESIFLRLDWRKMLKSRGRRLEVQEAVVTGPVIYLRRDAEGRWDFEDMVKRAGENAQQTAQTTDAQQLFSDLSITGLRIQNGSLKVDDQRLGRALAIRDVNMRFSPIVPGQDVSADVALVLDDAASKATVRASVEVRPLPKNLDLAQVPDVRVELHVDGLQLDSWGRLLPEAWVRPDAGRLALDIKGTTDPTNQTGKLGGKLRVEGLQVVQGGARGKVTDVALDVDMDGSLRDEQLNVHQFHLRGAGLVLKSEVKWQGRDLRGLQQAVLDLAVDDLSRVAAIAPAGGGLIPEGLVLEGPFHVHLQGDAFRASLGVDLDRARVAVKDQFNKPAGTPLSLQMTAERTTQKVTFNPVELRLGPSTLSGELEMRADGKGPYVGRVQSSDLAMSRLRKFFPAIEALQKKGQRVDATVDVFAAADIVDGDQRFSVDVELSSADVRLPRATLTGKARAFVQRQARGATTAEWTAIADASGLAVGVRGEDGKEVFRKRKGVTTEAHVLATQAGDVVTLSEGQLSLGNTFLQLEGAARGVGTDALSLALTSSTFSIDGTDVKDMLPAARGLPARSSLAASLAVQGAPGNPGSMSLRADDVELVVGRSHFTGKVAVESFADPMVKVEEAKLAVDFGEVRGIVGDKRIPEQGTLNAALGVSVRPSNLATLDLAVSDLELQAWDHHVRGTARFQDARAPRFDVRLDAPRIDVTALRQRFPRDDSPSTGSNPLATMDGTVGLTTATLIYRPYTLEDVSALIHLDHGHVVADTLQFGIYGGRYDARGTDIDLVSDDLPMHLVIKGSEMDLADALAAHDVGGGRVQGTLDFSVDVTTRGTTADRVMESIRGPVALASPRLDVAGANVLGEVFAELQQVVPVPLPMDDPMLEKNAPTTFRNVSLAGTLGDGALTLTQPLKADTAFGTLSFEGDIHSDSRINLVGNASLRPEVISDLTRGALQPPHAVLVPVLIEGTWKEPRVKGVDVQAFARGVGVGNVLANATEVAQKFQARADEVKKRGDAMRDAAVANARANADKAAEDARQRAEEARKAALAALKSPDAATADAARRAEEQAREAARRAEEARARVQDILKPPDLQPFARAQDTVADAEEARKRALGDAAQRADAVLGAAGQARADAEKKALEARRKAQQDLDATRANMKKEAEAARQRAEELLDRFRR